MNDLDLDKLPPEMAETLQEKLEEIDKLRDTATAFAEGYVSRVRLRSGLFGLTLGLAAGAAAAYVAYHKAETKYSKIADDEIAVMRQHYQMKARAQEGAAQKGDLEALIADKGYASPNTDPPMAVQPPDTVSGDDDTADESEMEADEHTPDVEKFISTTRNVFREAKVEDTWDYQEELKRRSPDIPYVIHYDERYELEDYDHVTLTYYEGDDVLCNERDEIVDPDRRDEIVGDSNLNLFGHGSNDASIVYVRNDKLELIFEVVRSPNHFAEEVHGITHEAYDRGNLERMRIRERDDQEK